MVVVHLIGASIVVALGAFLIVGAGIEIGESGHGPPKDRVPVLRLAGWLILTGIAVLVFGVFMVRTS